MNKSVDGLDNPMKLDLDEFWKQTKDHPHDGKTSLRVWVDTEVAAWFKSFGQHHGAKMNLVLHEFYQQHKIEAVEINDHVYGDQE